MTPKTDPASWLRRFHPDATARKAQLVCFPHAGGAAAFFFPVSKALAARAEVVAVQYPGRQERRLEPFVPTVEGLADAVAPMLEQSNAGRPLVLFGHSMGALAAYEVARRLERAGIVPTALVVSGRRAPTTFREENVHKRDDAGVIAELKSLDGTDTSMLGDPEMLDMILPAIRNDYRAVETYRHRPGSELTCPVSVFIGEKDPMVTTEEAELWRERTSGPFELRTFPGGHFYLVDQAPAVLDLLAAALPAPAQ